jgi:hypothetical protein
MRRLWYRGQNVPRLTAMSKAANSLLHLANLAKKLQIQLQKSGHARDQLS